MAFGFGAAKASNESQSTASAQSFDIAQSGSVSGGQSSSVGGSASESGSFTQSLSDSFSGAQQRSDSVTGSLGQTSSEQSIAFEDVFARLFGNAEGAAGGLDTSLLTGAANQLFSGGINFLDNLSGGADTDFLQGRLSSNNAVLNEQIGGLGEDIGQFFNQQILPGIQSEAIAGGGLGGSRQGIAEGMAAQTAGREFQRGATTLRAGDIQARDNAAIALGQNRVSGAQAGLGGLGSVAGIADFGFGADLAPFERLSALLGGQTVLGSSQGATSSSGISSGFGSSVGGSTGSSLGGSASTSSAFNNATAEDFARAFSQSFGQASSRSQSTASGSSRSFNLSG